jgi:undecaprenyl phosphate-alpha-L-ara4N flippase subunit ArnE
MNIIPWLVLSLVVVLGTTGQLSLKYAFQPPTDPKAASQSKLNLLLSPYFWIWFVCYILVTGLWLFVLRFIPLSQAFPALGLTFALIPLGSHYFLGEQVVLSQWLGIATIVAGAILVVQT